MGHLTKEDVSEAPMSERSFLAGETERNFVFEPSMGPFRKSFITVLEILASGEGFLTTRGWDYIFRF